jgi:hypothetical protein
MKGKTMDITINNGHEETTTEERETALRAEVERLTADLIASRESAHEQAREAEERRDQLRTNHDERMSTLRDRLMGELTAKQERIDALLETDQGKAYTEVEHMKREVERVTGRAELALERAKQAEAEKDRAWASVNGSPDIEAKDPRVAHIWRKASRIATNAGFCTEYDRIAEALGLPDIEFDYSGYVSVRVSAYVSVPVSGTATRSEIADGDVDWSIDNSDILSEMDSDSIEWEVDEVEISADDE